MSSLVAGRLAESDRGPARDSDLEPESDSESDGPGTVSADSESARLVTRSPRAERRRMIIRVSLAGSLSGRSAAGLAPRGRRAAVTVTPPLSRTQAQPA